VVGSTAGIAPVFYAYGNASVSYEPLVGQWVFSGYRRVVAMTGTPDASGVAPLFHGIAVVTDRDAPAGVTWAEQVTSQQVKRTRYVEGDFQASTFQSLLVGDPLAFAEVTAEHAGRQIEPSVGGIPNPDCADLDPVLGIPTVTAHCGSGGIVYTLQRRAWEGIAAPPSQSNTLAGSSTEEVDAYGRPTRLSNAGDLRRTDDDVCSTITYAASPNGGPFPSVPSAIAISDCGWGNPVGGRPGTPRLLSVVRFFYDEQPHGVVVKGRLTSREVDRYGSSGYLGTNTVDRLTYDEFGEVSTVTVERALGTVAVRSTAVTRDAFGATITSTSETASDVAETFTATTTVSSWPTVVSKSVDQTGVATFAAHDRFGRKTLSWVDPGGHKSLLSRAIYNDDPLGRSVTVETFPGDTAPDAADATTDKQSATVVLDALGRGRFVIRNLGADYGGARVVSNLASYDAMGRVSFVAAPFATNQNPFVPDPAAELFGTSTVYDRRGRVIREVSAQGAQPNRLETSVQESAFVRTLSYGYENGVAISTVLGAEENDPGSANQFSLDVATRTAIGRELRRARHAPGGARVDLVEQEWDRLGRVVKLRRYLNPALATGAVVWQSEFDSLGRRLSHTEPGTSTRYSTYDESGNEIESSWQDGSKRQVHRASFDGFGRITSRTLATIASGGGEQVQTVDRYHYDAHSGRAAQPLGEFRGRLSWAETDGVGAIFYGYDALGRSSSSSYLYQGHDVTVREATRVAPGGRVEGLTLTNAYGTDIINYTYDSAERMRRVLRDDGSILVDAQEIDPKGRYRRVVYGNGAVESFGYAPFGREQLTSWSAPGHIFDYLEFDAAGRIRFERDTDTVTGDSTFFGYEHDALGRLSSLAKSTGGFPGVERYTHDPLGNVLSRTATTGIPDLSYQRDSADPDRMCRIAAPGSSGSCQFRYDGAGNVVVDRSSANERRFEYDPAQRIRTITREHNRVSLQYGPLGRTHTDIRTSTGRRQVWHFGLIEEEWLPGNEIHVERLIPGPLGANVSLRTQIAGGHALAETVVYAHGDNRGNRVFTSDGGAVVQTVSYGTYGQTTTSSSGPRLTQSDNLWNGGDNLPEVGIVLLGPRAYDPELGRFLQRDPFSVVLRSSNANPYSFAFSNPVDFSDPTGLTPNWGSIFNLNIFKNSNGPGPDLTNLFVVGGLAITFAWSELSDSYFNPLAAVGAAGFDASASGFVSYLRSQQKKCSSACEFARDLGGAVRTGAVTYIDYTKGKLVAIEETGEEMYGLAKQGAIHGAKGPLWLIAENIYNAPETYQKLTRAGDAIEHAVVEDPGGTITQLACRGDGCGVDDYSRTETKIAIAVATPAGASKAGEIVESTAGLVSRFARRLRVGGGSALPELEISASKYPELAENILNAQRAGHPDVLTHGGNKELNRELALEDVPDIKPFSRDEYPFASSMEGGRGAWVGHIAKWQNSAQGGLISGLVRRFGLRPGDQYRVVIVP
jgi:RHS repeat-associated protein